MGGWRVELLSVGLQSFCQQNTKRNHFQLSCTKFNHTHTHTNRRKRRHSCQSAYGSKKKEKKEEDKNERKKNTHYNMT